MSKDMLEATAETHQVIEGLSDIVRQYSEDEAGQLMLGVKVGLIYELAPEDPKLWRETWRSTKNFGDCSRFKEGINLGKLVASVYGFSRELITESHDE